MTCSVTILGDVSQHAQILTEMGANLDKNSGRWKLCPAFTNDLIQLEELGLNFKLEYLEKKNEYVNRRPVWTGD